MLLKTSLFALLACVSLAIQAAPPAMPDQFGKELGLQNYSGQALLVIVVSARKARHIERWEQALRKKYPHLLSVRVADVSSEPKPDFEQVAKKLRTKAPKDVSILIDMDNRWALEYELNTDEPCLLIFSPEHEITAQFRGRAKSAQIEAVVTALQPYFDQQTTS